MTDTPSPFDSDGADALRSKIRETLRARETRVPIPSIATAQQDLADRLARATAEMTHRPSRHRSGVPSSWQWGIAAGAMILAVVFAIGVTFMTQRNRAPDMWTSAHRYVTGTGQQAVITLDDGTRATLAPHSELRVASGFGKAERAVALTGEVSFDVAHTAGAPFVAYAGRVRTRVLGTEFSVRHYADDPRVRVSVSAGKVAVAGQGSQTTPVTLTAGEVGNVTDSGAIAVVANTSPHEMEWRNGQLVLNEVPAMEVLTMLSRWYGYEFHCADTTLAQQRLTAVLSTQSSSAALATLKLLLDVDMTFNGNIVTLIPHRDGSLTSPRERSRQRDLITAQSEVGR